MNVIIDQLRVLLVDVVDPAKRSAIWNEWVETWSQFPFDGFLQSTKEAIVQQISTKYRIGLDKLDHLLPWPDTAITAYQVFSYTLALDASLIEYLWEDMGQWYSAHMHTIKGGMSELPEAFFKNGLKENVKLNFTVSAIEYHSPPHDLHSKVVVKGFTRKGNGGIARVSEEGHAVIITTPINIMRQIKFVPIEVSGDKEYTAPLPNTFYKSIQDVWYDVCTKIMIQCKTRFWEKKYNIQGGFSRTNLPIGQVYYPSNPGFNSIPKKIEKGILLCYIWKSEALLFGALEPDVAIAEAVEQISEIHPEINEEFDFGAIKAWHNDPAAQGAYAFLRPRQFEDIRWLMYPWRNIYFAGDAISFTNAWIQGALESGLRAAYQFYTRNENAAL